MTGLERFSVRGLRTLQNIILVAGVLLIPTVFFLESLWGYAGCSIAFSLLVLGYLSAERLIGRKEKANEMKHVQTLYTYKRDCSDMYNQITELFRKKGYSTSIQQNSLLKSLLYQLDLCKTVGDYQRFSETIKTRIRFVLDLPDNDQEEPISQKQSSYKKRSTVKGTYTANPWNVLGIPEGTTDMVAIKKAYKTLVKMYHPDLNSEEGSGEKTVAINLAYQSIIKKVQAS